MAEFEIGQTFLDKQATNFDGTKGKYFLALSSADYDNDPIICFVMNSERKMSKYDYNCNEKYQRFIIKPETFSFITVDTSIMLDNASRYFLGEMYHDYIQLFEVADILLCRQIKNCIDWNYISLGFAKNIKLCFKNLGC